MHARRGEVGRRHSNFSNERRLRGPNRAVISRPDHSVPRAADGSRSRCSPDRSPSASLASRAVRRASATSVWWVGATVTTVGYGDVDAADGVQPGRRRVRDVLERSRRSRSPPRSSPASSSRLSSAGSPHRGPSEQPRTRSWPWRAIERRLEALERRLAAPASGRPRSARRRRRRTPRPATSRRPTCSDFRRTSHDSVTPQSDSVATIGETTDTRPRKNASKRQMYESP